MLYMKLSEWAKHQGIRYETAWRWFKAGKMPVPVEQTATGTILVKERVGATDEMEVAIYARVSSSDQKGELDGQVSRLVQYASEKELKVVCTVTEIGSGLNGHRPKLKKLLSNSEVKGILVEHRDRLMRFGCEYVESTLYSQGRRIIVANDNEVKDDLVQDMMEVLTSFCARLYGRTSAKNKAKKALAAIES
jgi:putative resolvase